MCNAHPTHLLTHSLTHSLIVRCVLTHGPHPGYNRLSAVVAELLQRGATPFVLGGSADLSFYTASGLISVAGGGIGILNISANLHVKPSVRPTDPIPHPSSPSFMYVCMCGWCVRVPVRA